MPSEHATRPSSNGLVSPKPVPPILIVDDDLAVLEMLGGMLQEQGFPVVLANNGVAALYLLQGTLVSLIVTGFHDARYLWSRHGRSAVPPLTNCGNSGDPDVREPIARYRDTRCGRDSQALRI